MGAVRRSDPIVGVLAFPSHWWLLIGWVVSTTRCQLLPLGLRRATRISWSV